MTHTDPEFLNWVANKYVEALQEVGLETTVEYSEGAPFLRETQPPHTVYEVISLAKKLESAPKEDSLKILRGAAQAIVDNQKIDPLGGLSRDALINAIRTRIVPNEDPFNTPIFSYKRDLGWGISQVLVIDRPNSGLYLTSTHLEELSDRASVEELFRAGQRNVDNEPIGRHMQLQTGSWAVDGESHFIASKAANLAALFSSLQVDVPYGVCFGIPGRHVIHYSPVDPRNADSVSHCVAAAMGYSLTEWKTDIIGGVISADIFYWAPEGKITPIAVADRTQEERVGYMFIQGLYNDLVDNARLAAGPQAPAPLPLPGQEQPPEPQGLPQMTPEQGAGQTRAPYQQPMGTPPVDADTRQPKPGFFRRLFGGGK